MIEQFRGEYFFLSNMCPLENWVTTEQGIKVPTSEHAYQANKFLDPVVHSVVANARFFDSPKKPPYADGYVCKEVSRSLIECGVPVRSDLDIAKDGLMLAVVSQKFARNPELRDRLIEIGDQEIVEGNDWGDNYWGVSPVGSTNGENKLGKILMAVQNQALDGLI